MIVSKLIVGTVELAFEAEIPVSANYSVADIRQPDKRNSTYTKTVAIPGTQDAINLFEYAFDWNIKTTLFNANLKLSAKYYVNEILVFNAFIQLLNVTSAYDGQFKQHIFNCSIIGETANIFLNVANKFLTDLADPTLGYPIPSLPGSFGFTDLDHALTVSSTNPLADSKFNPTPGVRFVYGYIDYGNQLSGPPGYNWEFEKLKPSIFAKEYVDRIFATEGFTYTSTFLNSAYFKRLVIPDVNAGASQLAPALIQNQQFYAGRTTTITVNTSGVYSTIIGSTAPAAWHYNATAVTFFNPVPFNDETTAPFNDPGGVYNNSTFIFTTNINGWQTIVFNMNFTLNYHLPAGGVTIQGSLPLLFEIDQFIGGGWVSVAQNTYQATNAGLSASGTFNYQTQIPGNYFVSGTQFRCRVRESSIASFIIKDSGGTPITTGTSSLDFIMNPGSNFYNILANTDLSYGNTVTMNLGIPQNIKQVDFLMGIIKMHNLYIESDKVNPRNYIIEPREDFIQYTNPLDWTYKQDVGNDLVTLPMGDLDAKKYTFNYKSDTDAYNDAYFKEFAQTYGTKLVNITNDFVKSENVIDVVFSPTPGVAIQTDIVAPRLYKQDGNNVTPQKCNIRILYWGGMKPCTQYNLQVNGAFVSPDLSQYPYVGHLDDPNNPTVDLCFDNPYKLYWILPAQMYVNNNLYNKYYSKFISEISDRDSKIVQCKVFLDEFDINAFSFRKLVFMNGAYFFVNSISNYDPQVRKTVDVELLKLNRGNTFSSLIYQPGNPPGGGNTNFIQFQTPLFNSFANYSNNRSVAFGLNSNAFGQDTFIQGVNSMTGQGVIDFQGLGMTNFAADVSLNNRFAVRNGAFMVSDNGVTLAKKDRLVMSADFQMTDQVQLYYVDCTGVNVIATLPSKDLNNSLYTIVRIDNTGNSLTVVGFTGIDNLKTTGSSATSITIAGNTTRIFSTDYNSWYYG